MDKLYDKLNKDYRFREGLKACINCGTCTAICPAAEFYNYDPRSIIDIVQSKNDEGILELLKSETIWYCGECMSCVTRCPRNNAPGLIIMALRNLSQELGYFIESEKGRQQYLINKNLCGNVLVYGYCVYPRTFRQKLHPESGSVWEWVEKNMDAVYKRVGGNLEGKGTGILRKIPQESLDELKAIFDITGATERLNNIEKISLRKAEEIGMTPEEYCDMIYTKAEKKHHRS